MNNLYYASILCIVIGYFVGNFNPAYVLSKMNGFDIRERGSGNAGASNAMITLGKGVGIFCAIFDIFKAYFVYKASVRLFPILKVAGLLAGVACIIGHMFPLFMGFNGGKGLACLGGTLLAYDAKLFIILLSLEIVIAIITNYICVVPTTGSIILNTIMFIKDGPVYALIFSPVVMTIWMKHMINFKRIKYGVEARFSYLWNKEKEEARVRENFYKLSEEERLIVNLIEMD